MKRLLFLRFLSFALIVFVIFLFNSCLTGSNGDVDTGKLGELGGGSSGSGGGGGGSGGDGVDDLADDNPLRNPNTGRFNAFSPMTGFMEGIECDNPVDCFMEAQNNETALLDGSKIVPPPVCPYDKEGESISRVQKKIQLTLSLCMTSMEMLMISPTGILSFVHWSNGMGTRNYWVHGEGVGGDNWMEFYEYYNVGFCPDNPLDRMINLQRSDEDPIYEWWMPALLPYDLGLNIDTTCTISVDEVVVAPEEIIVAEKDWAANMANVPTWAIALAHVAEPGGGDEPELPDADDDQFVTGELSFTLEYWERLEDTIEE